MEQKTKVGIIVAVLVLLTLGVVVFVNSQKNKAIQNSTVKEKIPTETSKQDTRTYQEKEPNMKTIFIEGKVTTISPTSIEIIKGEVKNTFPITEKVLVASMRAKDQGIRRITDIKKDDAVTIVLNAANSEVVGIQIN